MIRSEICAVLVAGLAMAGCSYETRTQAVLTPLGGSEQACVDYGFQIGTNPYQRCVMRESEARSHGRVVRGYAEAQLVADSRDACYSYGLTPGTLAYDRCVGREIDARRYREDAQAYAGPPSGVYPRPTYPAAPYLETRNADTAGIQAFRDEYGFRYDAQGNRLDRSGNIISPQSTRP